MNKELKEICKGQGLHRCARRQASKGQELRWQDRFHTSDIAVRQSVESAAAECAQKAGLDRLMEYSVEITTVPGIADPDYLDRLAEIVYGTAALVDPFLGLNDNGSVTASFCVAGVNPLSAASDAVYAFVHAVAQARPLRGPSTTDTELASVGSFGISRIENRAATPA